MNFNYTFPAVRGIQAKTEYYICMVPCKYLSKLFITETSEILPEYKAQRELNAKRIPVIERYILNNRNSYVFSALAASIDGQFEFIASDELGTGKLVVDMSATFLINDGQHRKAAIEKAIEEDETLGDETIPVVFFKDKGLVRSQQMFTDLNKHAVNTSKSINTLYDSSDEIAVITKETVKSIPLLNNYTEKEKDTLGKYSKNLFTLSNFYSANQRIIGKEKLDDELKSFIMRYWEKISMYMYDWNEMDQKQLTKKSLRQDYVCTLGIVLLAFGILGNYFYKNKNLNIDEYLPRIEKINWLRTNKDWENKIIFNGKVLRKEENIVSTYKYIKKFIKL